MKTFPLDASNVSGRATVRLTHFFAPVGAPAFRTVNICKGKLERVVTTDPDVLACPVP